ncbi:MAG: SpaH/EbpB family LPXTG-anchored major pilin, partial [Eubacterium sp.]
MKKFASAATAVLLVALLTVSCFVTAFAATEVDTAQKGSIKLTKYDSEDVDNREPVSGAEFSVYRILDFDGKTYTVNNDFAGQVDVSDLVNTDASQTGTLSYGSTTELEAQISKLQNHITTAPVTATAKGTTGNDGVVTLENLDLGVYLVQETKVPAGYMVTTQAFLVALPTWDQENDTWVYAVEATPKNETLQVEKQITDGNQNTPDGTADDSYSIGDTVPYTVTAKIPNYGNASDDPTVTVTKNLLLQDTLGVDAYNALNLVFTNTLTKG